jgi:hypothetical protein
MKLYLGAGVITAIYALVLTSLVTTEPSLLLWNGIVGFMLSLSLVLSLVPRRVLCFMKQPQMYCSAR